LHETTLTPALFFMTSFVSNKNHTMKKKLQTIFMCALSLGSAAQTTGTGPSSSQSAYLQPLVSGANINAIFTATNTVGNYTMSGLPDGSGGWDNGDGTFTMLMNHEIGNTSGAVRAHGSQGAFVSKWIINKSTMAVISGTDLIQNVNIWNGTGYTTYNATTPSTLAAFGRFCSADLPDLTAYYNPITGKGTTERIFMNGEENGNEGRAFGHICTGTNAGTSYELPYLGKCSLENLVASPFAQDKTIVVGLDDTTPGQVYFYIGTKTNSGNEITKAGLTGGKVYGVAVASLVAETNTSVPVANTTFSLIDLGQVQAITGASLNTMSNNMGVTTFLRPEDGAWDPSNPRDFYFLTTNGFTANSRLWKLRFNDITNPEQGGVITAVLDGTEGQKMMDNMCFDNSGHIYIQEDVGNQAHNGKMWVYDINTDVLTVLAQHDPTRFITGGANFLTQDEEASGVFDAQAILGPGMFMFVDQAHYSVPSPVQEGGQILSLYSPLTHTSNPEINVIGNSINVADGSLATSIVNNTNFGTVITGSNVTKTFVVQNTGLGALTITGLSMSGTNATEFSILGSPVFPMTVAPSSAQVFTVQFTPTAAGTRSAIVNVINTDYNENWYDYVIDGQAILPTGINEMNSISSDVILYPNPTSDEAIISFPSEKNEKLKITILDVQGKKLSESVVKDIMKGENLVTLNTSEIKNGIYFVQLTAGDTTQVIKMAVAH
jgi:hypothetical protein